MGRERIFILAFILFFSGLGTSEAVSGRDLLDHCENKGTFQHGYCYGYIQGTIDYNALADYVLSEKKMIESPKHCISSEVSLGKAVEEVVQYLKSNPEKLNQLAGNLVLLAIDESFHCPKE
jgi:hypothetical protein